MGKPHSPDTNPTLPSNVAGIFRDLKIVIEQLPIDLVKPYGRRLRKHSNGHIESLVASISLFGFVQPILIDGDDTIVSGEGVFAAAKMLKMQTVPVVRLSHLSKAEQNTLRIALNKLAENSAWDTDALKLEFGDLLAFDATFELPFDLNVTGFSFGEIDQLLESPVLDGDDDEPPAYNADEAVSQLGDIWELGVHRIICGDALRHETYSALMDGELADMGLADPPYDVNISGHVSTHRRHREFVMGAGELGDGFQAFLTDYLGHSKAFSKEGVYQFAFMDWRHMSELLEAGSSAGLEMKNLCVWNKGAGAMGSLYRSQHELVFVFKGPRSKGVNNVQLGKFGRNRTNVWDYPGSHALTDELKLHPTPKNVAMTPFATSLPATALSSILSPARAPLSSPHNNPVARLAPSSSTPAISMCRFVAGRINSAPRHS